MGNCLIVKSSSGSGSAIYYSQTASTPSAVSINADQLDGHSSSYYLNVNSPVATLDVVYPVGSIYMSVSSTNPSVLFGGVWEQIQDTFLLSAGSTYVAGNTGGSATVTLTTNEMPAHTHTYYRAYAPGNDCGGDGVTFYRAESSNNSGSTGGGQAHDNMPPYLVVYMWKRTA